MSKREKGIIQNNTLLAGGDEIQIGSSQWLDWLNQNKSFRYKQKKLSFSARKEKRRNDHYWYAYKRVGGKLIKLYLGKREDLDSERLKYISRKLVSPRVEDHQNEGVQLLSGDDPESKLFLNRKVKPPLMPGQMIPRQAIIKQMNTRQLVFINAPAGFGKTTLISAWFHSNNILTAWITLDQNDNVLSRFWVLVNSALVQAGLLINLPLSTNYDSLDLLVSQIVNEIEFAIEQTSNISKIAVVFDDYHLIADEVVHQSMQLFIEQLPQCVQIIIAGRPPNRFKLGKLRTRFDVVEINQSDLLVSFEDGRQYLESHLGDIPFPKGKLYQLVSDLDGWVAGLQLTAMILSSNQLDESSLPIGKHEYLQEFLVEDVLNQQPPEIQEFLIKTSFLGDLNAQLCEAVTGNPNSKQILRNLWGHHLFISKLDGNEETYQYQKVFSQALQTQLFAQYESETTRLLKMAAEWNLQNENYGEAVNQYFAASEWNEAIAVIETVCLDILKKHGEDSLLLRWFQLLPKESLKNHFDLVILYIILIKTSLPPDYVHINLNIIKRDIATWDVGGHEKRLLTDFIDEVEKDGPIEEDLSAFDKYIRNEAYKETVQLLISLFNYMFFYRRDENLIRDLLDRSRQQNNKFVLTVAATGHTMNLIRSTRLKQAHKYITDTLSDLLISRGRYPGPAALLYTDLAIIYFERGQWHEALKALHTNRLLAPNPTSSNNPVNRNLLTARIYAIQGNFNKAQEAVKLARRHYAFRESTVISLEDISGVEGEIYFQQGDVAAVERIIFSHDLLKPGLMIDILNAKYLLQNKEYEKLLGLVEASLERDALSLFATSFELELMQALALYELDQVHDAKTLIIKRLREFAREKIIRPFLTVGPELLPLLRIIYLAENLSKQIKAHIETIFREFGEEKLLKQLSEAENMQMVKMNVTHREKEILTEMARGHSNLEIALNLQIAESTVKTHINNIYQKFSVSNRVQAIHFANEMGILSVQN
jgi:LuxR family maltose regulon positive regulatory protein